MAGLQEFESLSNTYAQRSLILVLGKKRRAKILPHRVQHKKPRSSHQGGGEKREWNIIDRTREIKEHRREEKKKKTEDIIEETQEK